MYRRKRVAAGEEDDERASEHQAAGLVEPAGHLRTRPKIRDYYKPARATMRHSFSICIQDYRSNFNG